MPANPMRGAQLLGYAPAAPASSTFPLSAAGNWLAFGLLPWASKTLTKVRVFISAVAGTLGVSDLTCDVYSDAPGQPGASLGSVSLGSAPSGAGWVEFAGLSVALTAGTQYWLVLKNVNATPGTNNATYRYLSSALPVALAPKSISAKSSGPCVDTTANSGTTWTATNTGVAGIRVGYADGSYEGLPASNVVVGSDLAFGANEVGVKFTSPANVALNVAGVAFQCEALGSPSGQLRFRLYGGTTLLGTTNNLACVVASGSGLWYASYFAADVVIQPATVLRATFCDSAADGSSNCFKAANEVQIDTDANSLPLLPLEGTLEKTTFNGTSWTDTNASILPFALILDSAGEFAAQGGGGRRPKLWAQGA